MSLRNIAFVVVCLCGFASGAIAAETDARPAGEDIEMTAEAAPVPLRWVPGWLMTSISKAIADATDPSERGAKAK